MDTTLTFRQERFVFEYLKDQNASAAAARAGYTAKNMAAHGNELMSNPAVRDRVRFEMQSLLAEIRCSALELMKQRMRAAFFDAGKLVQGWEPIALEELDEETRRAVEVRTVLRKGDPVVHVKQPDRHKALRALEKVHERLDQLNEKYYAKLEKAGEIPSLEEIERRADEALAAERAEAEAAARDILQKPQVLSGSGSAAAMPASQFSEIPQVFSGSAMGAGTRAMLFPEKHQVLLGPALGRADARGAAFAETR
ncbi:MAG TPA: terminase small subunit [Burkholderiales bacterium]|nr:terminase small subunit [Burkholderiales bacterium]